MTEERLIEILDDRLRTLKSELGGRFASIETEVRHAHVQIEGLRGEMRQVAESVILVDEKLERFRLDTARQFEELRN